MTIITTLYRFKQHLGVDSVTDDARLLSALESATAHIQRVTQRYFTPHIKTINHDVDFPQELLLNDDLLKLTSLTNGDGTTIDLADVIVIPDSHQPASLLILTEGVFTWETSALNAITVSGVWGWHDDWSQAWHDTGDVVQDNPLSANSTTLTVTDANVVDALYQWPRFQVGQLLKIEDEYLRVLEITINESADDTLTVQRGVNGTTASAHAQSTSIYRYQAPADIESIALRWATWLYKEPDARTISGIPSALMRDLDRFRRFHVGA